MTGPVFEVPRCSGAELAAAVREHGFFYVRHPLMDEGACERALALARRFFARPAAEKQRVAIEGSPHFRGYSEMRNERDWREQMHFGPESAAGAHPLWGPNLWPEDAEWRSELLALMTDLEWVGAEVLRLFAGAFGFAVDEERPYSLLKLIHYLSPGGTPRPGVAAHVDFSWLTLLVQDAAGGLEVRGPDGVWRAAEPVPGALVVNTGEILQFVTGGRMAATPHRVMSRGQRISLPFFVNPGFVSRIEPVLPPLWIDEPDEAEHVHRVLALSEARPFAFGAAEHRRKVEGVWCRTCCAATATL